MNSTDVTHPRPRRGGPPLPAAQRRNERVDVYLRPAEREQLTQLAAARGMTVSDLARSAIGDLLSREAASA